MGDQIDFDERTAAQLEVVYRTRAIRRRRALAEEALACRPGDEVLDVGCGPGFFVVDILEVVGARSEERRVGNAWRCRSSPFPSQTQTSSPPTFATGSRRRALT